MAVPGTPENAHYGTAVLRPGLAGPRFPRHRDESHRGDRLAGERGAGPRDHDEVLALHPGGKDQASAVPELTEERRRNGFRRGRGEDGVEGGRLRPAVVAVPDADAHVVPEAPEELGCPPREIVHDLDRVDGRTALGEDRGLVSGTRSDLEDAPAR